MISSRYFIDQLTARGFGPYTGVPCSFLRPFINYVSERRDLEYVALTNEGEAVAFAAGAALAGRRPVVMLQNSGLGNTVNPVTSLSYIFKTPFLMICTWRGQPGHNDEPQHELMGQVTAELLDLMRVPRAMFPTSDHDVEAALDAALASMSATGLPYAFIMTKGSVDEYELTRPASRQHAIPGDIGPAEAPPSLPPTRFAALQVLSRYAARALTVATTGKTGRELFTIDDAATNLYLVGSMGCVASVAFGVARYQPQWPVIAIDGDGAALMRLEAMASIGHYQPANMVHVILDNQAYESTGGQPSIAGTVSFPHVAIACGYRSAQSVATLAGLSGAVERALAGSGPHLIHMAVSIGSDPALGRPTLKPHEVAARFSRAMVAGPVTAQR